MKRFLLYMFAGAILAFVELVDIHAYGFKFELIIAGVLLGFWVAAYERIEHPLNATAPHPKARR